MRLIVNQQLKDRMSDEVNVWTQEKKQEGVYKYENKQKERQQKYL